MDRPRIAPFHAARARHTAVSLLLSLCPRVMQALRRHWQARGPGDITFTQLRILGFVGRGPGVPLRRLALHLMVSAPSASRRASRAARAELERHPVDLSQRELAAAVLALRRLLQVLP